MGGDKRPSTESVSTTYQHIVVRGLPYDRGFQHGQLVRGKILENITFYKQPGKLPTWPVILSLIHECYIPGLRELFPAALEEMSGIAAGANVSLDEIIMLNARYDLSRFKTSQAVEAECTSAIFLAGAMEQGSVITAQNWDMAAHLYLADTIVYLEIHPDPSENLPAMFIVTEAGQLCRSGMNTAGLGLTANSLQSSWDYLPTEQTWKPLLPASLVRRLFLHQNEFALGLKIIAQSPVHVSSNITVATSENIGFCFEVTPRRVYRLLASPVSPKHYLIHANHFMHPDFTQSDAVIDGYLGGSSWYRTERLEVGVRSLADIGFLTEKAITTAFKDHVGYPRSLCEHVSGENGKRPGSEGEKNPYAGPNCTVVCVLYNLSKSRITVCKGPPCTGVFVVHELRA